MGATDMIFAKRWILSLSKLTSMQWFDIEIGTAVLL